MYMRQQGAEVAVRIGVIRVDLDGNAMSNEEEQEGTQQIQKQTRKK